MFSQTVEYALRAVIVLAAQNGEPVTAEQIAERTLVPRAYLSKVMQNLCRHGIVHSQRGLRGGFTLCMKPEKLTILEVVNAVEPIQRIKTCPLGIKSHGVNLCPLHHRLDLALAMVEKAFAESTMAEIMADPNPSVPLCEIPKQLAVIG